MDYSKITLDKQGKQFVITDFGAVNDSTVLNTKAIQAAIDAAAMEGGVVVIPKGVFCSGALFFKPKTHLYLSDGAKLKGSDNIMDYPKLPSRMEGQCLSYFAALINAYGVNGFTISGKGTIDGNGLKYWEAFWQRRKENPNCTNLEVSRPRLIFMWNCSDIQVQDVKLQNSGFWTSHYYKCKNVKVLDVQIVSPAAPVKAPSTDAIDIDVCTNVLIKGCYLSVNDDAIALKGGKGPWADKDTCNGPNYNIVIEDCTFGFCHSAVTCGSESIYTKNVLFRNCKVSNAERVLWLKMRPDTPQRYECITVDNITGSANCFLFIKPWTQFFDLQGRTDMPVSISENITLRNINFKCDLFTDIIADPQYSLVNFSFENINASVAKNTFDESIYKGVIVKSMNVRVGM